MITIDDDQQWPAMIDNNRDDSSWIFRSPNWLLTKLFASLSGRWCELQWSDALFHLPSHLSHFIHLSHSLSASVTSSIPFLTCLGEVTSSTYPLIHSIRWARPTFCSWQTLWRPSIGSYRLAECTFPSRVTLMWFSHVTLMWLSCAFKFHKLHFSHCASRNCHNSLPMAQWIRRRFCQQRSLSVEELDSRRSHP